MQNNSVDNKRIAKNTLFLYIRMIILMAISLYTSRVVLATLGVDDYGLYYTVGGIVSILAFLNTSMAGSTQRFLNVEMGRNDDEKLNLVFNTSRVIHLCIAVIVFLLAETIGVWFLNNYMTIAPDRMGAANWVFQFSIVSFLITIISVPYNAAIISHEKMSAFAYISVVDAVLRLLIVFLLDLTSYDKLIVYSILMAATSAIIRLIYSWYCIKHFAECRMFSLRYDKEYLKKMASFSGWTVVGALGSISHTQGVAIVINMFFSVAVNAAQGIANQVINVVNHFVSNFMTALNPQIVKSYASGDLDSMHTLMMRGSRMGFFLITFFSIPLIIETPVLLAMWLKEVPEYTVIFVRIIIVTSVINSFASPLSAARGATGDIKNYQIVLTALGLLHIPLAWICFEIGYPPYSAMIVYLILIIIMQACRIFMTCRSINLKIAEFYSNVVLRCVIVFVTALFIPYLLHLFLPSGILSSIFVILVSVPITAFFIYIAGITTIERKMMVNLIREKIRK